MRFRGGQQETQVSGVKVGAEDTNSHPAGKDRGELSLSWASTPLLYPFPDNHSLSLFGFLMCRGRSITSLARSNLPSSWAWLFF